MQFPAAFLNVLEFVFPSIFENAIGPQGTLGLEQGSNLLVILNSCMKFYIFMVFGRRFRKLVTRIFFCKKRRRNDWENGILSCQNADFLRSFLKVRQSSLALMNDRRVWEILENYEKEGKILSVPAENRIKVLKSPRIVTETSSMSTILDLQSRKRSNSQNGLSTTSI